MLLEDQSQIESGPLTFLDSFIGVYSGHGGPETSLSEIVNNKVRVSEIVNNKDQFLIFASNGLWENLSNQEAVDIVQNHLHNVRLSSTPFSSHSKNVLIRGITHFLYVMKMKLMRFFHCEVILDDINSFLIAKEDKTWHRKQPILSWDSSIPIHEIQLYDQFLIFASDGL
ncbi:Protein phosphatase 2C (PP2C)-like protein [Cynara cardunculus var. scolymus]|uniref:Protein phosphatase 2C (PP2C)-like protein n=1 Tax=Cynara cardunculus var. scolymus TaxID=59895 RepID=A0A124SC04_CYNCS|nr:Protein phosphatase 2C (PP2C)-like protein [Cynara cardunculus var. scolymus]